MPGICLFFENLRLFEFFSHILQQLPDGQVLRTGRLACAAAETVGRTAARAGVDAVIIVGVPIVQDLLAVHRGEQVWDGDLLRTSVHTVSIPMETVTEITDNGPKTYDRKVFPGYVLVKMIMSDEAWYIIKNVRGVTGFVGSGTKPTPLTEEEVQQLGVEKHEIVVAYSEGDNVRVADGPLTGFIGVVDLVDIEKNKVRVIVSMFGRETPVELELDQVEVINQ